MVIPLFYLELNSQLFKKNKMRVRQFQAIYITICIIFKQKTKIIETIMQSLRFFVYSKLLNLPINQHLTSILNRITIFKQSFDSISFRKLNIIIYFKQYKLFSQDVLFFKIINQQIIQIKILFIIFKNMIQALRKGISHTPRFAASYILKNGRIVNSDFSQNGDVLIEEGKITQISSNISHKTAQVIDCSGKMIIPGGIDTHTHMQLPFMGTYAIDDFDSGSKAAIAGGTTSFIDFAIPGKQQTLTQAYNQWRQWADPKVNCDYALHSAITSWNDGTKDHMKRMVQNGITSFKFFMAYNNVLRLDDVSMFKAFQTARDLGAICIVHAENGDIIQMNQNKLMNLGITGPQGHYLSRPQSVQAQAVHRVITIAQHANCPVYIVHLMSRSSSQEVMRAKNKGLLVYGQTLAATIGTDGTKLFDKDWDTASKYVMSPCLSPDPTTKEQIMKYLNSNVIDVVGTDNCTFCTQQKRLGQNAFPKIPNGVNGLQDRLSVVWTKGVKQGLLTQNQFVDATSTKAAKIFNMFPHKGIVKVGADADVVVWDPDHKRTITCKNHHQKVDFNVFEGMQAFGKACLTFSRGKLVWNGKDFLNQQQGKYFERKPFGFVYGRHKGWTERNNPLKFKVDRSESTVQNTTKLSQTEKSEIAKLQDQLARLRQQRNKLFAQVQKKNADQNKHFDKEGQFVNTYQALKQYLPSKVFDNVRQILYGPKAEEVPIRSETKTAAQKANVQIKQFRLNAEKEETRQPRLVKIAAIQNRIVLPTDASVPDQKKAIMKRIGEIIQLAAMEKANFVCLQEVWTAPFFMCTREKYPWVEFSEPFDGQSTQFLRKLAKKHNVVIVSSILERQKNKQTLHNTAVIIDNHGDIMGKQIKGHIPRVGDFNQSTYYMEGDSGHPVFDTDFGKIGVNICYGRHHPLHWQGFGLNGAEIVFNPSATINGLSQPLWGIQARNAAIANHYFSVGINRVGTEIYPHEFTSGDKKSSKRAFGHFYGSSYVAGPDGSKTPELSRTRDGLLLTEIDLNLCRQTKDKWMFTATGRHQLYADLLTKYSSKNFVPQIVSKRDQDD